jgi:hypothetical protein
MDELNDTPESPPPPAPKSLRVKAAELMHLATQVPTVHSGVLYQRFMRVHKFNDIANGIDDVAHSAREWEPNRKNSKQCREDIEDYLLSRREFNLELNQYVQEKFTASANAMESTLAPQGAQPPLAPRPKGKATPSLEELFRNMIVTAESMLPEGTQSFTADIMRAAWFTGAVLLDKRDPATAEAEAFEQARMRWERAAFRLGELVVPQEELAKAHLDDEVYPSIIRKFSQGPVLQEAHSLVPEFRESQQAMIEAARQLCQTDPIVYEAALRVENYVREEFPSAMSPHEFKKTKRHEARLSGLEEARAGREALRQRAEQEAEARVLAEAKRVAALKEKDQPYVFSASKGNAGKVYSLLQEFAGSSAASARHGQMLVTAISNTLGRLDISGASIEQLGDVILSDSNLKAAARAFEVEKPVQAVKATTLLTNASSRLRNLYTASSAVREVVDTMLQSDDRIVLLATLTRGHQRSRDYASFLAASRRELRPLEEALTTAQKRVTGWDPEELRQLEDEPDVINLRKATRELEEKHKEIETAREALATEIRQSFQGISRKKTASAAVPVLMGDTQGPELSAELKRLFDEHADEFHRQTSPQGDKHVLIVSNDFPEVRVDIKRTAKDSAISAAIGQVREQTAMHRVNQELRDSEQLDDRRGFHIVQEDGKQILQHREYAINVQLEEGDETRKFLQLQHAAADFAERQFAQQALLRMAAQAGIPILGVDAEMNATGPILLTLGARILPVAPRGYFSEDDFTATKKMINEVQRDQQKHAELESHEIEARLGELGAKKIWQPEENQTLIILDASTLQKLAARREAGLKANGDHEHTWLDLVKQTSRLPHVKIIIPAVVADWELQGKIPVHKPDGPSDEFVQIDPRYGRSSTFHGNVARPVSAFLETASRARITGGEGGDRQVLIREGASKNIIVMETADDDKFYEHIREIMRGPQELQNDRFKNEIKGKGAGEEAITRIVNELPQPLPMMIVSDDNKYFRESAPITSGSGMAVGHAGTATYLEAELGARRHALRSALGEEEPLWVDDVMKKIRTHWLDFKPEDPLFFSSQNRPGFSTLRDPDNIYSLIKKGHQEQMALRQSHSEGGHASSGRWTDNPGARNRIPQPRSITPQGIRHQMSNDPERGNFLV